MITQENGLRVARYTLTGLDEEGKECNLENREAICPTEEEAQIKLKGFMTLCGKS